MNSAPARKRGPTPIEWVLERLESKCSPQGLNVMAEELRWMGLGSITYNKLWRAVREELRSEHPNITRVAEGVYWFAEKSLPPGWGLYTDRRMLPCFYRVYPPAISWDDLDRPENILPSPAAPTKS